MKDVYKILNTKDKVSMKHFYHIRCDPELGEGFCLYLFIKQVNVSSFNDNGGVDVHQSNDTIREFHLHLSDSKLQNAATTTAHLHILLAKVFEKKNDKGSNSVRSNRWMRKAV